VGTGPSTAVSVQPSVRSVYVIVPCFVVEFVELAF
jgi:hypothetical protein